MKLEIRCDEITQQFQNPRLTVSNLTLLVLIQNLLACQTHTSTTSTNRLRFICIEFLHYLKINLLT